MQVRELDAQNPLDVFGIYWAEYQGKIQRFHLVIPENGYPGFITLPETDCELVDPVVANFVLVKDARENDTLVHPILQDKILLDRLIDHDPEAMDIFLSMLTTT